MTKDPREKTIAIDPYQAIANRVAELALKYEWRPEETTEVLELLLAAKKAALSSEEMRVKS